MTYEIEMPLSVKKTQTAVHICKLKPYVHGESDEGVVDIVTCADGAVEQAVRAILDRPRDNRRFAYLIQFVGQPESKAFFLPRSELRNCMELVIEYDKSRARSSLLALECEHLRRDECNKVTPVHLSRSVHLGN